MLKRSSCALFVFYRLGNLAILLFFLGEAKLPVGTLGRNTKQFLSLA